MSLDVRQPRPLVTVNGFPLTGVLEAEVTNASHFSADTFRVLCSSRGLPPALGPDYWGLSVDDRVTISAGLDGQPTPLITGQVDLIDYDPIQGTLILSGRDLSAQFLDSKTSEKFQNQTSSQIAQALALRHGLDSNVYATTTKAGSYYSIDNVVLTQEQTEWDLLVYLAEQEGFDVWVSGNTLFFQPSPVDSSTPYLIRCSPSQSDALDLRLTRSETLAKDIIVRVLSFHQKGQKKVEGLAKATGAKSQRSGGKAQTYTYRRPNLTQDKAQKLAESLLRDLTKHELVMNARMPGDNLLSTRTMIRLIGTATAWDQLYYPDSVSRTISVSGGYTMEVRAKNHHTQSTV